MDKEKTVCYHKSTFDNIPPEKRERILSVATAEFADKGFENANINHIAKKAGVSVGSLYKYFDTKNDLFFTTVYFGVENLKRILYSVADTEEDVLLKLRDVLYEIQKTSRQSRELIRLYNGLTRETDPEVLRNISFELESVSARLYTEMIIKGQQSGEIRKDLDPRMGAFLLDNLLMSLQFTYACDYYEERFRVFVGEDLAQADEFVVEQMLKFVSSAFAPRYKTEN